MKSAILGFLLASISTSVLAQAFFDQIGLSADGRRKNVNRVVVIQANPFLGDNLVYLGLVENLQRRLQEIHGAAPFEILYLSPVASKVLKATEHVIPIDLNAKDILGIVATGGRRASNDVSVIEAAGRRGTNRFLQEGLQPQMNRQTLVFNFNGKGYLAAYEFLNLIPRSKQNELNLLSSDQYFSEAVQRSLEASLQKLDGVSGVATLVNKDFWAWEFVGPSSSSGLEHYESARVPARANFYVMAHTLGSLGGGSNFEIIDPIFLPEAATSEQLGRALTQQDLDPRKAFVLLNYNAGPDKAERALYYEHYLKAMIEHLRRQHAGVNIVLTSPQAYALPAREQSLYEAAQGRLAKKVVEWNDESFRKTGHRAIAEIPSDESALLSAAVRDSRLVISQDTGLIHFANIRKRVPLSGRAVPQVISFVPGAVQWLHGLRNQQPDRWQAPSQPIFSPLDFAQGNPVGKAFFAAVDAGLGGTELPMSFGQNTGASPIAYYLEFPELQAEEKKHSLEQIRRLMHTKSDSARALEILNHVFRLSSPRAFSPDAETLDLMKEIFQWWERNKIEGQAIRLRLIQAVFTYLGAYAAESKQRAWPESSFPLLGDAFWSFCFRFVPPREIPSVLSGALTFIPAERLPTKAALKKMLTGIPPDRSATHLAGFLDALSLRAPEYHPILLGWKKFCSIFGGGSSPGGP